MSLQEIWVDTGERALLSVNSGELHAARVPIAIVPVETQADVGCGVDELVALPVFEAYPNTVASWSGRLQCSRE